MGMFDEIVIRYPLPEHPEMQNRVFQTKDLELMLERYTITKEGYLTLLSADEDGRLVPAILNLSQTVSFYGFVDDETNEGWVEYVCQFWEGKLEHIALVQFQPLPQSR